MRHVVGFFLALVTSAALFFGGGWGIAGIVRLRSGTGLESMHALLTVHNSLTIAAVLATGLLLGIMVAVRRVSALATGLPGLGLLAWSGLLVMRGGYALTVIPFPGSYVAAGFAIMLSSGALALLGMVMALPLFMPSRWRRELREVEYAGDEEEFNVHAVLGLAP